MKYLDVCTTSLKITLELKERDCVSPHHTEQRSCSRQQDKETKPDGPFGRLLSIEHRVGVDVKLAVVSQGPGGAGAGTELAWTNIFIVMRKSSNIYR